LFCAHRPDRAHASGTASKAFADDVLYVFALMLRSVKAIGLGGVNQRFGLLTIGDWQGRQAERFCVYRDELVAGRRERDSALRGDQLGI
jgi:hypothetical protein